MFHQFRMPLIPDTHIDNILRHPPALLPEVTVSRATESELSRNGFIVQAPHLYESELPFVGCRTLYYPADITKWKDNVVFCQLNPTLAYLRLLHQIYWERSGYFTVTDQKELLSKLTKISRDFWMDMERPGEKLKIQHPFRQVDFRIHPERGYVQIFVSIHSEFRPQETLVANLNTYDLSTLLVNETRGMVI